MATKAQVRASAKYNAENTVQVAFRLNKAKDAAIIEWLGSRPSKAGYIKALIRRDMDAHRS